MLALLCVVCACGQGTSEQPTQSTHSHNGSNGAASADPLAAYVANGNAGSTEPDLLGTRLEPFFGDFESLKERKIIRVLVTYSQTHYFLDGLTVRGITAESLAEFGKFLRRHLDLDAGALTLLPVPVARDQMIDFLDQGLADMAIGNLTITPERLALADFSVPTLTGVSEVLVTGPNAPELVSLDDLAGQRVFVRASSSFRESLDALNERFSAAGRPPVEIVPANENLQTEDILELANAGVVDITVADSHVAAFWSGVLTNTRVRDDLPISSGRSIGWAIRKDARGLKPLADVFVRRNRKGTLLGNILFKRYLQDRSYVENAAASEERQRLLDLAELFQRYSSRYAFDWLMVAAQAYQESRLIHDTRSPAGAVGVMQILPRTARSPVVGIDNIEDLEANIHAGHKYLRHLIDHYFADPEIDELNRTLFAFAAYNAGPSRVNRIRRSAARRGLDPNLWFGNVERLVAEQVGREPVQYVRNILKYYTTYSLLRERHALDDVAAGAGAD